MSDTIRINFHCHSNLSDGQLSPEHLASRLAEDGVRFAALTDHHTLDGLARFHDACAREGIGVTPGVEIFAESPQGEIHLLAYGFDPTSQELKKMLEAASHPPAMGLELAVSSPHKLLAEEVFKIVHQAGGKIFFAHPLDRTRDPAKLEALVRTLKASGLDGLEAIYAPYTAEDQHFLLKLAATCDLPVSGGSDFHGPDIPRLSSLGVDMPRTLWARFRDHLFLTHSRRSESTEPVGYKPRLLPPRLDWVGFFLRILLPTLVAIGLLVVPTFSFVIPAFEDALMVRKREMIRELTQSAASILTEYYEDEKSGRLSREDAQRAAAARVEFLRYGKEGKDYFWITDMHPRMVMHPYRTDLNGHDVSAFRDPKGNPVFMEFLRVVKEQQEGYVEYVWQWKDDPARLAAKQSYVKGFAPWGWVIGTGIYVEDVRGEIEVISGRIIHISAVLAGMIALLLLFVALQSLRFERRRHSAEEALRESHEKYRVLVEASTEGTMLVMNGRLSYANQTLRTLLGYTESELPLLDVGDVILASHELPEVLPWLEAARMGTSPTRPIESTVRKKNGETLDVLLAVEPMTLAGKLGCIVKIRDLRAQKDMLAALDRRQSALRRLTVGLPVAILRTSLDRGMRVIEANPAAFSLFGLRRSEAGIEPGFGELFVNPDAYASFRQDLSENGEIQNRHERLQGPHSAVNTTLTAIAPKDQQSEAEFCEILAESLSARPTALSAEAPTTTLPLLLQNEPVARYLQPLPTCEFSTPIHEAATRMESARALLVIGPGGEGLGLVTDSDFRTRVVSRGLSSSHPVHEIMSAPLVDIPSSTPAYLASLRMQEEKRSHLIVKSAEGQILGGIALADLQGLESNPLVALVNGIRNATRLEELLSLRAKLPPLIRTLCDVGGKSREISGVIAAMTDVVTGKLIDFACQELGPPPAPFAFLALGSQGRYEQTLASDQDNALVFEVPAKNSPEVVQSYFLALGERVCGWLARAGYSLCKGGAMASNPRFCSPLPRWKELFSSWINIAEPKDLLEFNIFFDFRCIHGQADLVSQLHRHVLATLNQVPGFFVHLAQNALHYKSLLSFFGNIVAEPDHRGSSKSFNIKEALTPIISFARLYALRAGVSETNTVERLQRLGQLNVLSPGLPEEIAEAYQFLLTLRLRHQCEAVRTGQPFSNQIGIKSFTRIEENTLKEILAQVTGLQKRIAADFLGGAWTQSG